MAPKISNAMMFVRLIAFLNFEFRISNFAAPNRQFQSAIENRKSLPPLAICRGHLTQKFKFIEAFASPLRHRAKWIFSNVDRQTCFLTQKLVKAPQQRTSASQH